MNGLLHFRFKQILSNVFGCIPLLIALFVFSDIVPTLGQGSETFKCPENSYTFTGFPAQTLCEQNPNFNCEIQIGTGTPFPKSSLLGTSVSGNVCIVGNFEVDQHFSFLNAVVKINPGVTIAVKPSPNGYDPGSSLVIDNSNLFACNGLWKGITIGHLSTISTVNSTKIEDAEKAIYATGLSALTIQETTFNRNRIGLELDMPFPTIFGPGTLVWVFSNNHFTCDAPLNGTTNEITEAGVKLKNSVLYAFISGLNSFSDLKYGIYSEGDLSHIGANSLYMQRIKKDGIYMKEGSIDLRNSWFNSLEEKGMNIETAKLVKVTNTQFRPALNPVNNPSSFRTGIFINKFALNAVVQLNIIDFSADMEGTTNKVIGIHLKGGNVGAGTNIHIGGNSSFSFRARDSRGIYLDGVFPSTSRTEIRLNNFRISTTTSDQSRPQGILADNGDKNNLSIKGNTFTSFLNANIPQWATGIELRNNISGGKNEVRENTFSDANDNLLQYIIARDFQKNLYCSNTFSGVGGWDFEFLRNCPGTSITGNTMYGTGYGIVERPGAFVGEQKHLGNQWYDILLQPPFVSYGSVYHAWCQSDPASNKFTVHTQQSTCSFNPTCFNPYHPQRIRSDMIGAFFAQQSGTPSPACDVEFTGGGTDELDRQIGQGILTSPSNDPAAGWVLQRYLYQKFKDSPFLTSEHASFPVFMTANENTTVGKFYDVHTAIENALKAGANIDAPSAQALSDIGGLMESMAGVDEAIEQQGLTAVLKAQKEDLIHQIHGRHWAYNSLRTIHEAQVAVNLQTAFGLNQAVATTHAYEINEKTVNQIRLLSLMQQGGEITISQITELESIAKQDIEEGGPAVTTALGMLPACIDLEKQYEYLAMPDPRDLEYAQMAEERNAYDAFRTATDISVSPNPASNSFTVRNPSDKNGTLTLFDISGKTWLQQSFSGQEVRVDLKTSIPPGLYLLRVDMQDGTFDFEKLIIQSN